MPALELMEEMHWSVFDLAEMEMAAEHLQPVELVKDGTGEGWNTGRVFVTAEAAAQFLLYNPILLSSRPTLEIKR